MLTPSEIILRKAIVINGDMTSADWDVMDAAFKDRAFVSSRVASVNFLDTCMTRISDLLDASKNSDGTATSRAQVVSDIMRAARAAGISQGTESIRDPGSLARASVIIDTNAGMAAGYARAEIANTYGARLAFPAQELVRVEDREAPRQWKTIWTSKGGKLYQGRMIALKGDAIWTAISRFGLPYPPFDFNSGMGVEEVSFDEAVELGVISKDYQPPEKSPLEDFNERMECSMSVSGPNDAKILAMKKLFGEQIQFNPHTKKMYFDGAMINDVAAKIGEEHRKGLKQTSVKAKPIIGLPSDEFVKKFPTLKNRQLRVPASNILHVFQDHVDSDKDSRNIPLTQHELSLIGHVWRQPEEIGNGKDGAIILKRKDSSGNHYELVVSLDESGGLVFHTFYKVRKSS